MKLPTELPRLQALVHAHHHVSISRLSHIIKRKPYVTGVTDLNRIRESLMQKALDLGITITQHYHQPHYKTRS